MSNALRLTLGAPVGIIGGPLSMGLLAYGVQQVSTAVGRFQVDQPPAAGLACVIGGCVLIAMLAAARWTSPVAALIAGVIYALVGAAFVPPLLRTAAEADLLAPLTRAGGIGQGMNLLGSSGMLLGIGALLLTTVLMPNRWRARTPEAPEPAYGTSGDSATWNPNAREAAGYPPVQQYGAGQVGGTTDTLVAGGPAGTAPGSPGPAGAPPGGYASDPAPPGYDPFSRPSGGPEGPGQPGPAGQPGSDQR
ncbi:MAG: hypothetical protein GEV11_28120 [Streptosporangiales bacterium]|nr:hypothetical protein [Streptosporangiales bacterium]